MSTDLQINLFDMELSPIEGDGTAATENKVIFSEQTPTMKRVQVVDTFSGPSENYVQLSNLKDVHAAARLKFLRENLSEGDLLQIADSYNGKRYIELKFIEERTFNGYLYEPDKKVDKVNVKKKTKKSGMTADLDEIVLIQSKRLGSFVFNENPLNGLSYFVEPIGYVENYINGLTPLEKEQLITLQLYFGKSDGNNYTFDKIADTSREFVKYIRNFREPSHYRPRYFGVDSYKLSARRCASEFEINFFGEKIKRSITALNSGYTKLIDSLKKDFNATGKLNYNDIQLAAYYSIKGYIVDFSLISNEWSIKHNFSDKVMYFDREEALIPELLLNKYNQFCKGDKPLMVDGYNREDYSDTIGKYLKKEVNLIPFKLPVNAVVKVPAEVVKITSIKEYSVINDDGKQVELKPLGASGDSKVRNVILPRSKVSSIKFPDTQNRFIETFVPFGIPAEADNSGATYLEYNKKFAQNLSERELRQMLVFKCILVKDVFLHHSFIHRAIFENDFTGVKRTVHNGFRNSSGGTFNRIEILNGRIGHSGDNFSFYLDDNSININLKIDDVVDVIAEMYTAINTLERSHLTLYELKWLYSFTGNELIYTGFDTHFVFNEKSIHSTKHDILALA